MVTVVQNNTPSPWGNSDYLILDKMTGKSIAVDPWDMDVLNSISDKYGCVISSIFVTHTHRDHIHGTKAYLKQEDLDAPETTIFCHKLSVSQIGRGQVVEGGDVLLGGKVEVVPTPGHRPEHLSLFIQNGCWVRHDSSIIPIKTSQVDAPILIAGDCLFDFGIGNCTNGGDVQELYLTVSNVLMTLPDSTRIMSGHDYRSRNLNFAKSIEPDHNGINEASGWDQSIPSTIGQQREANPFFRFDSKAVAATISRRGLPSDTSKERFSSLRKLRDDW